MPYKKIKTRKPIYVSQDIEGIIIRDDVDVNIFLTIEQCMRTSINAGTIWRN